MKTKTINLYEFSELSDEAKQTALNNNANTSEYFWGDDAIKSLEKFMEHFNCSLTRYSIDWFEKYRNEIKIDIPDYMENISVKELRGYIKSMGKFNPKTKRGLGECKFTGYCADEDAADGARKAFFGGERNLYDILYAGYKEWYRVANTDYEFQLSEEGFSEHCDANDYEFNEDGTRA